jgi:hypothetical protein
MLIIDEKGKALSAVKELPGIRLNMNDTLRYNKQTKKVYWSIDGHLSIATFALDPDKAITLKPADAVFAANPGDFEAIVNPAGLKASAAEDFLFTVEGTGNSQHIKITGYKSSKMTAVIPERINGLPVTVIGNGAFTFFGDLGPYSHGSRVILPAGLTTIESAAFMGSNITDIIIPAGVTSIGSQAFDRCRKLTTVAITGPTAIEYNAFPNCTSLRSVTIPQSVKSVGSGAFSGCPTLTAATRAEILQRFGAGALGE